MGLLPRCPIHEGPAAGGQNVHEAVYTECANLVVEEEVFDNTADDMCLIPIHSTSVLSGFGSSVIKEDKAGSASSCRVGYEMT